MKNSFGFDYAKQVDYISYNGRWVEVYVKGSFFAHFGRLSYRHGEKVIEVGGKFLKIKDIVSFKVVL